MWKRESNNKQTTNNPNQKKNRIEKKKNDEMDKERGRTTKTKEKNIRTARHSSWQKTQGNKRERDENQKRQA
jgi:hypothetical protein